MMATPLHSTLSRDEILSYASKEAGGIDYDKKLAESERKDKFDDHKRVTEYKNQLHKILKSGMWVIGLIMISLILVRAWHLATPAGLQWLEGPQLHSIDAVLFSSIIFSLASRYFTYYKLFQKGEKYSE